MVKTFIINIFLVLAVSSAMAQNSISGIITDKNEVPIPLRISFFSKKETNPMLKEPFLMTMGFISLKK